MAVWSGEEIVKATKLNYNSLIDRSASVWETEDQSLSSIFISFCMYCKHFVTFHNITAYSSFAGPIQVGVMVPRHEKT